MIAAPWYRNSSHDMGPRRRGLDCCARGPAECLDHHLVGAVMLALPTSSFVILVAPAARWWQRANSRHRQYGWRNEHVAKLATLTLVPCVFADVFGGIVVSSRKAARVHLIDNRTPAKLCLFQV